MWPLKPSQVSVPPSLSLCFRSLVKFPRHPHVATGSHCLPFPSYLQTIECALEAGDVVLIENLEESIDPVLGPLLGREVIKKGR